MTQIALSPRDAELVLVLAPRGRDSALAVRLLEHHGLHARACESIDELVHRIHEVGCAVITTESLSETARAALGNALAAQRPWSDFPLVLFVPRGADLADRALDEVKQLGNVTLLERPVHTGTLVSSVRAALRARRRQYEAREAIQRRDQFLAMLGHELRNPLGAILLALESIAPTAIAARPRDIIERQARHLARLVDDLLDVARVTSGKVRLVRESLELTEVMQRCVQSAELGARARDIELRYAGPAEPLVVDGDLVRLEEIASNLIGNALKYSPPGSRVDIEVRGEGDHVVIEVIDQGIGIAPELLARVFDLFVQAEVALDRSGGGLGIGLTLVRALVELHGGTIRAHSAGLGKGSRFTVRLPRSATPASELAALPPPRAAHAPAPEAKAIRVVLVEDNEDLLEATTDLLSSFGCEVAAATDGPSGLALLLAKPPDIAFVDIGLPGLDGYKIAERVRAAGADAMHRPYLVAMSGYGQPEDRERSLAAGFDQHLTKPVTVAALERALGAAGREAPPTATG